MAAVRQWYRTLGYIGNNTHVGLPIPSPVAGTSRPPKTPALSPGAYNPSDRRTAP